MFNHPFPILPAAPRGQEKHGREYFFVSQAEFDSMVIADAFVEWANVHSHRLRDIQKSN